MGESESLSWENQTLARVQSCGDVGFVRIDSAEVSQRRRRGGFWRRLVEDSQPYLDRDAVHHRRGGRGLTRKRFEAVTIEKVVYCRE